MIRHSAMRAAGRLLTYLCLTFLLIPVQFLAVALKWRLAVSLPITYHGMCARLLGFDIRTSGKLHAPGPTLFVCNHVSYLDITMLGAVLPASFVAKSEVARWPLFGLLAKLQRSVFVDRRPSSASKHRDAMQRRLEEGDSLILFAEGTSGDGLHVLPFRTALFSAAEREVRGRPLVVQPVSITYPGIDGLPTGRAHMPWIAWYGDMGMGGHLWNVIGLGRITVDIAFHEPTGLAEHPGRRHLALACHAVVAEGVDRALAGRRVPA